uniref:Uncharacterized protein n=1 Tax=Anopheles merus TaxID=30066 RepID=A0A2C9H5P4_ANOME
MKSIVALVLFVACAAQVQSACVNTNLLYRNYDYVPGYSGLGYYYNDALGLYPGGVLTYGSHYPRSCSCGKCDTCTKVSYPYRSYYSPLLSVL